MDLLIPGHPGVSESGYHQTVHPCTVTSLHVRLPALYTFTKVSSIVLAALAVRAAHVADEAAVAWEGASVPRLTSEEG